MWECVCVTFSDKKAEGKLKTTKTDPETRGERRSDGASFSLTNGPVASLPFHHVHTHTHTHTRIYTNRGSFHYVAEREGSERHWVSPKAAGM